MLDYLTDLWAEGVENAQQITINGLEAATGTGRIRTNDGTRDVRLVAIRFTDNQIYRFIFATKPDVTDQLAGDIRTTIYSFRQLSASEAAELRPQRIQVVQVASGDTVESMASLMAFEDYRVERFLVLNGLKRGDRLQAGQLVKIIVE
jgi:predicted Zn-dependent protease